MARTARRPAWIGILLTVLAVAGIARAADDAASTPYAVLHAALSPALEVEGDPHLRAVQKIESKLANVAPRDIEVTIDARGGPIRVPVAADGRVAFPLRDDLLAENPPVRSNQPRGSLTVSVTLALASPRSTRVPVGEFSAALDAADAWLSRLAAAEGGAPPVGRGGGGRCPPGAGAWATRRGGREGRRLG
ncbi:MAG: hypothetical protein ACK558_03380, partial [Pseudomonadota bacterium]